MQKRNIIIAIICVIVVGSAAFYSGIKYDQNSIPASVRTGARGNFGANAPGTFAGGNRAMGSQNAGGFISGQVLSKDSTSITIQMRDGSSKIVLYSPSTQVSKMASGTINDIAAGTNINVTGTTNTDGSITSQSIQIRPNMPTPATQQPAQTGN